MALMTVDPVVYDYTQHAGPYCTTHRSVQCEHALGHIVNRADAEPIKVFIENMPPGNMITLYVPLWPEYYMWEDLRYEVVTGPIGAYGRLQDRGRNATYDLGVNRLMPGESAFDLGMTMVQQFRDLMEVDQPDEILGCRSGSHKMTYQRAVDTLMNEARQGRTDPRLFPHLYGLIGRKMCGYCWADAYGGDARRVSGNAKEAAKVKPLDDLIPDESLGEQKRRR